jgi:hypothetical protein
MSVLSGSGEDSTDKDKDLVNSNSIAHGKDYNPDQRHFITRFLQSTSISPDPHEQSFESFHTPPSSPSADDGNMSDVFVTPPPSPDPASGASATGLSLGLRTPTPPCTTSRPLVSDAGLDLDFLQINCGKIISAMALLETNVKNKIALIQEPYTSINSCTPIHKRDFFSSGTAPLSTTPAGATPATS